MKKKSKRVKNTINKRGELIHALFCNRFRFNVQKPWIVAFAALFFTITLQAQTLRGSVQEAQNGQVITGATVNIYLNKSEESAISIATSPSGEFTFEGLRPGYYRCEIIAMGFETIYLTEILVTAGKEQVLEIALRRSNAQLPEVTIATSLPRGSSQALSEIPLSRDQTLRFPAMFFDPGRLAAAFPGVSQTDDATNSMSIRGNSPAMVRWRIEGLDIVNPNHLPNANTMSDAPAAASGGVLMFSSQMLDNSALLTGAFPAGYGDAIAGVMDMNLRAGNRRQHEFTGQASLIGLDIAAEGPIRKGKDNSYLVNYRYSTVGLLGQLGVSFGDEQINFQDFSFHLNFTGKKGGQYAVFGLGGLSDNQFSHKEDSTEIKYDKERYDIDFHSKTGVVGASGKWKLGARNSLKAALAYSTQVNEWQKKNPFDSGLFDMDNRTETRLGGSLEWRIAYKNAQFHAGVQASSIYFKANIFSVLIPGTLYAAPYNRDLDYINIQPWLRWDWTSGTGRWIAQLGAQFHYNNAYQQLAPAPRGALTYRIAQKHKIAISAGLYKQDAPLWMQYVTPRFGLPEFRPPYISSLQTGLRYTWNPSLFWKVTAELFQQATENIPGNQFSYSSLINTPELVTELPITGTSKMRNYGLEFGVERSLQSGWFFAANGSIFKSQYQIVDRRWLDTRWDIGHLSNLTFGKEWQREKTATLTRTVGVGLRGVWAGGPKEADIDLEASEVYSQTIYNSGRGYYRQNPDYFRVDARVYWRRSLGDRRNSTFALDLLNLTGQQNLAYHYYDPFTGNIENKYQLGTIPNLSWRVEF